MIHSHINNGGHNKTERYQKVSERLHKHRDLVGWTCHQIIAQAILDIYMFVDPERHHRYDQHIHHVEHLQIANEAPFAIQIIARAHRLAQIHFGLDDFARNHTGQDEIRAERYAQVYQNLNRIYEKKTRFGVDVAVEEII